MAQTLLRSDRKGQLQALPQPRRGRRGLLLATSLLLLLATTQVPTGTSQGSPDMASSSCATLRVLGRQARWVAGYYSNFLWEDEAMQLQK